MSHAKARFKIGPHPEVWEEAAFSHRHFDEEDVKGSTTISDGIDEKAEIVEKEVPFFGPCPFE